MKKQTKQVSILATGNEITSGQVVNTNAAWLAQSLEDLRFDLRCHLVVGDEEGRIKQAFEDLAKVSDLVFVIGGLGPTRDDLSRQMIAQWLGKDLVLDSSEWERIQSRLNSLGVQIREGHKNQAYFPKSAKVFENKVGTASGFSYLDEKSQTQFFFLPGPPSELKSVWFQGLKKEVARLAPSDGLKLWTWQFIDIAESELAFACSNLEKVSEFFVGYRASPPMVELKVWAPWDKDISDHPEILKVKETLQNYLHSKNSFDYVQSFLKALALKSSTQTLRFSICDPISEGWILSRIFKAQRLERSKLEVSSLNLDYATSELKKIGDYHIELKRINSQSFECRLLKNKSEIYKKQWESTMLMSSERFSRWACEVLFKDLYLEFDQIF